MTISTVASPKESLQTGAPSSSATSSSAQIYSRDFNPARPLPLPDTVSLESVIRRHEADPEKAAYLARARQNLAKTLYADEQETVTGLRLAAGLSQVQLAERAKTSQPHIARIERGQNDPSTDLIVRIAKVLDIDEDRAFRAVRNQLSARRQSE